MTLVLSMTMTRRSTDINDRRNGEEGAKGNDFLRNAILRTTELAAAKLNFKGNKFLRNAILRTTEDAAAKIKFLDIMIGDAEAKSLVIGSIDVHGADIVSIGDAVAKSLVDNAIDVHGAKATSIGDAVAKSLVDMFIGVDEASANTVAIRLSEANILDIVDAYSKQMML